MHVATLAPLPHGISWIASEPCALVELTEHRFPMFTNPLFFLPADARVSIRSPVSTVVESNIPIVTASNQGLQRRCLLGTDNEHDLAEEAGVHLQTVQCFLLDIANMSTFKRKIYRVAIAVFVQQLHAVGATIESCVVVRLLLLRRSSHPRWP